MLERIECIRRVNLFFLHRSVSMFLRLRGYLAKWSLGKLTFKLYNICLSNGLSLFLQNCDAQLFKD